MNDDMTETERSFALHKSRAVMDAAATNLVRSARAVPYALPSDAPQYGRTFVCVGAGPSLAKTGPVLRRLQDEGAIICTVNTALSAVNRYVVPDVVLAREVVDVSSHLRFPAGLRVLDLAANPEVWRVAQEQGPCSWFVAGALQFIELACAMNVRPLFGGPAALTALVAWCEAQGAGAVVLVGCDLAIAGSGASYADGSAFSGQRAVIGADGIAVNQGEGFARKQEQHARAGLPSYSTLEKTETYEAWGGGTVRSTTQWADQIPWLANFATRHTHVACIDATGAGVRKPGWTEVTVDRVNIDPLSTSSGRPAVARVDVGILRLRAEAETALALCATTLDPDGCVPAVPGYLDGLDHVAAAAAGALLRIADSKVDGLAKVRAAYGEAISNEARRLLTLLDAP